MNAGLLIIILLLGLSFLGFPIYLALGIGALAALNLADLPLIVLPQRMFAGMNGSALLAIPFFILAGNIMSRSITGKLIDICNAIIGHIKGSLSLVTILASALFGAISGSALATALGVPSSIIGVTVIAIGTSLPELVTTLTAIVKKESSLSVGNIIGANIIDLTMILPVCSLLSGGSLTISQQGAVLDLPACFLIILLGILPPLVKGRFYRWQGAAMLAAYAFYVYLLVT